MPRGRPIAKLSLTTEERETLQRWASRTKTAPALALRRLGMAGTEMARAQCQTMRLKLLKIGAQLRITVRKVWVSLTGGYPYAGLFAHVYANLQRTPALRC